jgi:hypothetical protein
LIREVQHTTKRTDNGTYYNNLLRVPLTAEAAPEIFTAVATLALILKAATAIQATLLNAADAHAEDEREEQNTRLYQTESILTNV